MVTKISEPQSILCIPGVQPSTDATNYATKHWTDADKIRFVNGFPQKIGGWAAHAIVDDDTISGKARSIYSAVIASKVNTLIGTHEKLYSLIGNSLTNVTPLDSTTIAIAATMGTHYGTLANDSLTTTNGSTTVTVADADAARYKVGDLVTLSGATATGGVPAGDFNTQHRIRTLGASSYTIRVSTAATSDATGGGAAVVRADGLIRVTLASAHGMANGDRVKINAATAVGGITAGQINVEHIVRNIATLTFDVMTAGTATSSVSGGGGGSATYQQEIADGQENASLGIGWGAGLWGVGLWGVSGSSTSGITHPRIWFTSQYATEMITTPGNQSEVYRWDGDVTVAPTVVANAPTAVNYAFVSDNILVTLGAGGVVNKIFASDLDDITNWTASSLNHVYEKNLENAGRLLSHLHANGLNLIFSENKTFTFRFIGLPDVWEVVEKDPNVGIISAKGGVVVNDVPYWMGQNNWYMRRGGDIEVIPSNTSKQSTILRYVFDNINTGTQLHSFGWYNKDFNEIWWHYPSAGQIDPDRIARLCLTDFTWTPDTMERIAAESPNILSDLPKLAKPSGSDSVLYKHETGNDDDTAALSWSLKSYKRNAGRRSTEISGIIPDSVQTGNVSFKIDTFKYPQSTTMIDSETYTVSPTTEVVPIPAYGRWWEYTLSGSVLGQNWIMGNWLEEDQPGGHA